MSTIETHRTKPDLENAAVASREEIARAIYAVTVRWVQPNFPKGHKLRSFDEIDDRERRLNLEYADAALAAAKPGWLPIETAPRDGTLILIHRQNCGRTYAANGTCADDLAFYTRPGFFRVIDATHWMPLPEPPK